MVDDERRVTVMGLLGGRHRASPIHRRRARAASFNSIPPSKLVRPHGFPAVFGTYVTRYIYIYLYIYGIELAAVRH